MRKRQGQLFRKYALVLVALVGATIVASNLVQLYFSYQETQQGLLRVERAEAARAALRISQFVDAIRSELLGVIPPPGLANVPLDQRRADYLELQRRAPEIEEITFIDPQGKEQLKISRLSLNLQGQATDRAKDPEFTRTRTGDTYYGPVQFRSGSEPHFRVAVPDGKGTGVTVADANLRFALEPVSSIKVGQAGHAYVVDGTGRLIAHPDISAVLRLTDLSSLPQVKAALAGNAPPELRALVAQDAAGRSVLTAYESIPATGWAVFVEQPLDEAFAPLNASLLRAALLLAAALAIAVAASLLLARRMTGPIQTIRAGTAGVAAGSLAQRIELRTGDELEDLADDFNRMTERLRESYATLEQKVVERTQQLAETSRQLEVASRHKSDFLASMSHELRTPLNAVIGYSEMLQEQVEELGQQELVPDLRKINTAGRYLLDLINGILDLSKIEAGKMELFLETFEVAPLVEDVTVVIQPLVARKGNRLEVRCPPALGEMRADKTKVRQVLFNLLSNAAKFTEQGRVSLEVERTGGDVHFDVSDTGIGISEEQLGRLFQAFSQASAETQARYGGTGLGLALAQRFCQLMGGEITATSAPGVGSRFAVRLPAHVAEAAPAPVAAAVGGGNA